MCTKSASYEIKKYLVIGALSIEEKFMFPTRHLIHSALKIK